MPQPQQHPAELKYTKRQVVLGLVAVFLIYATSFYFMNTLGIARPKQAADLNGMSLYAWLISIPGLAAVFVTLIFLKFSDMYGRRKMLLLSLSIFLLGTILCAVSPTFVILIAASTIARLGSGAIPPLCLSVVGDMFPPAERSKWIGMLNIPGGVFALFGPTLGGWLVDSLSWRYIYWIGTPLVVLCLFAVPVGVPSLIKSVARKIDVRGSVLMIVASSSIILAFSFAGTIYPWVSVQVLGLLAVSLVFWTLFFRAEMRVDEPLLDPQVFRNRTFLLVVMAGLLSNFGLTVILIYFPLFLQGVQGISAMRSGQILTPFGVLMGFTGVPTGFLLARTKRYKWLFVLSYAFLTAVMCGTVFFTAKTSVVWSLLVATLGGLGLGAVPTIKTLVVQCIVPKRLLGVATGALFFTIAMSRSIAPAILGSVMNVAYEHDIKKYLPAELNQYVNEETMTSLGNPRVLLSKPAMTQLRETFDRTGSDGQALFTRTIQAIQTSMESSLRVLFVISAATMLLAFLLILAIREVALDVEVKDKKVPHTVAESEPSLSKASP